MVQWQNATFPRLRWGFDSPHSLTSLTRWNQSDWFAKKTSAKSDLAENINESVRRLMSYYVYTLYSVRDGKLYTGFTADLKDRISRHNRGEVKSTVNRRPLHLIHYECFMNEKDARSREVFLKSGFGRDNLKKSLKRTLSLLRRMPM